MTEKLDIAVHDVDSSNVARIGHSAEHSVLRVVFKNGAVYDYAKVTEKQYIALGVAESKGKFINAHIKPNHTVTKV